MAIGPALGPAGWATSRFLDASFGVKDALRRGDDEFMPAGSTGEITVCQRIPQRTHEDTAPRCNKSVDRNVGKYISPYGEYPIPPYEEDR